MASICNKVCFTNYPIWNHWSMQLYYGKAFHFSASQWDGMSLHTHRMFYWSLDVLYKKPMYSFILFLRGKTTKLNSREYHPSSFKRAHYPNGYRFLQFDKIRTNTWNREKRGAKPRLMSQERQMATASEKRLQGLTALASKLPLSPASCGVLRQYQGVSASGKPLALSEVIISRW